MQVKGVLCITPFKNQVAYSVGLVKFSEGVEGCAEVSWCDLAVSSNTSPAQMSNWGFYYKHIAMKQKYKSLQMINGFVPCAGLEPKDALEFVQTYLAPELGA